MEKHEIFFYSTVMFLAGIWLASLRLDNLLIAGMVLAAAVIFLFFRKAMIVLLVFVLAGAFYYSWQDFQHHQYKITFNEPLEARGVIVGDPVSKINYQTFYLELSEPLRGRILVRADLYPEYQYGDLLNLKGEIQPPPADYYGEYLAKEGIHGTLSFAEIEFIKHNQGNVIKAYLLELKSNSVLAFQKLLSTQQAAFLSGITFGERGEFSEEFLEKLSASGTRHLIALSGLHLTIIVFAVSGLLCQVVSKKKSFVLTFLLIMAFVAMTGFKASAIRAAFMAFIINLARNSERIYSPRNSIALAGLVLVLFNPRVLLFDVGFQLSFLAIIGIIYLTPTIIKVTRLNLVNLKKSFLGWKEILLMTVAAQVMTAPLLITQFDNFTLTAFFANVLILPIMPVTMVLGFLIGMFYYLFQPIALLLGWLAALLIDYKIFIIDIFSRLSVSFNPQLGWPMIVIYYGVLAYFIYLCSKSKTNIFS